MKVRELNSWFHVAHGRLPSEGAEGKVRKVSRGPGPIEILPLNTEKEVIPHPPWGILQSQDTTDL